MEIKDWAIAGLILLLMGSLVYHNITVGAKNDTINDLRIEAQNLAANLQQAKVERDSSLTKLVAVQDLVAEKDSTIAHLESVVNNLREVVAVFRVRVDSLEYTISIMSQPSEADSTVRTFAVEQGHLFANGEYSIVEPYWLDITLGHKPYNTTMSLFVTDDDKLAVNYDLGYPNTGGVHVFSIVSRDLFLALFGEEQTENPLAQAGWFKRFLSRIELGIGTGVWNDPSFSVPLSVEIKYNNIALEGIANTNLGKGVLVKYYINPFK